MKNEDWENAIDMASKPKIDVVPPEWKTIVQIKEMIAARLRLSSDGSKVRKVFQSMRSEGKLEEREFCIIRGNSGVRPMPHFRIKKPRT